jgi:hypothetical protein
MRYSTRTDGPIAYDVMINTASPLGSMPVTIVQAAYKELLDAHAQSLVILGNHILVRRAEEALSAKQVNPRHI